MSRLLKTLAVVGVLAAVIAGLLVAFWPQLFQIYESEMIRAKRIEHWTLASTGHKLSGTPDLTNLTGRLDAQGLKLGAPVLLRVFKREFELEVWLKNGDRYQRFATYPICMWSGELGPKLKQGDRQSPEGFYTVDKTALNPNSSYHLSFNLGFPNAFDRTHGRTGSFLMVHGDCRSVGCYAMTDDVIDEIWKLVTAALNSGQPRFQVQVFPFRMTDKNMAWHAKDENASFWQQLKEGNDLFERGQVPPNVSVCRGRYVFRPSTGAETSTITEYCPS